MVTVVEDVDNVIPVEKYHSLRPVTVRGPLAPVSLGTLLETGTIRVLEIVRLGRKEYVVLF
jgi:hypothetical protein